MTKTIAGGGWRASLIAAIALGVIVSILYGCAQGQNAISAVSVGLLLAGAGVSAGGMIGFLFGIPRALQGDASNQPSQPHAENGPAPAARYGANTNLEQISDWLTKILVGVGLTQLTKLPGGLATASHFVGRALAATPAASEPPASALGLACAALIYFPICGFLFLYLWSRIYLAGALAQGDFVSQLERVEQKVDAQSRQSELDARALSLLARQVHPDPGTQAVVEKDLVDAIAQASPSVRVQVFYQAERLRASTWTNDKPLMERTIPLFRGLIASDGDRRFHRNYGQLGYALKDQSNPQWDLAEQALTTAIRIRDAHGESKWFRLYEFNRALCRIRRDADFVAGRPSSARVRDDVMTDLSMVGSRQHDLFSVEPVPSWLDLNKLSVDSDR